MTGEATYHSVSVAGVVIDENGRTLVIQRRDNGHWEPPGGVLEREESIIQGLLREEVLKLRELMQQKRPGSSSSR